MPALEALVDRFESEANTKVVGISVDSRHSHANWAWDLGGVSFPLLADFQPRGAVAQSYGVFLEGAGITDRATVIIDANGVVRHASSVTPAGKRDIDELLKLAKEINAQHSAGVKPPARSAERACLAPDATLYVREGCGFCRSVLRSIENLHCQHDVKVRDVNKDPGARADLEKLAGAGAKVPALVQNGKVQHESADIIRTLAGLYARV